MTPFRALREPDRRRRDEERPRPAPNKETDDGEGRASGKKRLAGDTARAATSDQVKDLRREASALKEVVAELMLENRLLKKSTIGAGEDGA